MINLKNDYTNMTLNEFIYNVSNFVNEFDIDINNGDDCQLMLNMLKSINKIIEFDLQHKLTIIYNNECEYLFIYKIDDKFCYYDFDMSNCCEVNNFDFCIIGDDFVSQCKINNINDLYNDIINNTFLFDEIEKNDFIKILTNNKN